MTSHPRAQDGHAMATGRTGRIARYAVRLPFLLWHVLIDLPGILILMSPPFGAIRLASGERLGHRVVRWWSSWLMRIFGWRMSRVGTPLPGAVLFVANHVSWIDITALHSQHMMGFVAKREIRDWPVVGWLAAKGETIFHTRGSQESLGGVLHEMLARLREDRAVGVFPEGRTRDGRELGPFHARIFIAAVEAGVPVQPIALRYGRGASAQSVVAFRERETFLANFLRLLGEPARDAEVVFLDPILPGDTEGRRRIADTARERIVAAMHRP